jgi:hypothetical protein
MHFFKDEKKCTLVNLSLFLHRTIERNHRGIITRENSKPETGNPADPTCPVERNQFPTELEPATTCPRWRGFCTKRVKCGEPGMIDLRFKLKIPIYHDHADLQAQALL